MFDVVHTLYLTIIIVKICHMNHDYWREGIYIVPFLCTNILSLYSQQGMPPAHTENLLWSGSIYQSVCVVSGESPSCRPECSMFLRGGIFNLAS
jgi:hypothetical protein